MVAETSFSACLLQNEMRLFLYPAVKTGLDFPHSLRWKYPCGNRKGRHGPAFLSLFSTPLYFYAPSLLSLKPHSSLSTSVSPAARISRPPFGTLSARFLIFSSPFLSSLPSPPHLPLSTSPLSLRVLLHTLSVSVVPLLLCLLSFALLPPPRAAEVEPNLGTPRRRPLSFCPCCSPEGNVTSPLPPPLAAAGLPRQQTGARPLGLTRAPTPPPHGAPPPLLLSFRV